MENNNLQGMKYYKMLDEYISEMQGKCYLFEVTKECGYKTLVIMYKNELLIDLYQRISHHLGCTNIRQLYFINADNKQKTQIPLNGFIKIKDFISENINCNPKKMKSIYELPLPVVYKIFLDDGHIHI